MNGAPGIGHAPRCPRCGVPAARASSRYCRGCGAPLHPHGTGSAPETPGSPRRRRRLLAAGALLAVSVLAATSLRLAQLHLYSPEEPVEEYLAMLDAGDADGLAELLGLDSPLVRDGALAHGYRPPEETRIVGVREDPSPGAGPARRPSRDHATVEVEYRIGGETCTALVPVRREATGWLRGWTLAGDQSGLVGTAEISAPYTEGAEVAGATLGGSVGVFASLEGLAALPGTYTVAVTDGHPLFEGGEVGVLAVLPDSEHAGPAVFEVADLEVRAGVAEETAEQIRRRLEECAESALASPVGCPFRLERDSYYPVEVEWSIVEQPEIRLATAADPLRSAPVVVETTVPGAARAEVAFVNLDEEPQTRTADIFVGGGVDLDEDGEVAWNSSGR